MNCDPPELPNLFYYQPYCHNPYMLPFPLLENVILYHF